MRKFYSSAFPCHSFFFMKTGKRSSWPSTYYFSIPYFGEFTLDRLKKLESNKKIRNLVAIKRNYNGQDYVQGWITSERRVLGNTFQMWLDCRLKDLVPNYNISESFLRSKIENPNCIVGKVNGATDKSNQEYEVAAADISEIDETESFEYDSDQEEFSPRDNFDRKEYSDSDEIDEDDQGFRINEYNKSQIHRCMRDLKKAGILTFSEWEINHYVAYCHRHMYDVENWKQYIICLHMAKIEGKKLTKPWRDFLGGCPENFQIRRVE